MVSVSIVQPSLNQEFLHIYLEILKMSLYTLNEETQSKGLFHKKSNASVDPRFLYDILKGCMYIFSFFSLK